MGAQSHGVGVAAVLAIAAAVVLGHSLAAGQVPQIDAGLKANENVGVGFDLLQETTTTVRVRLDAPVPWNIVKDGNSSRPVAKEGTVVWNLDEWTAVQHTWEGTNITINPGHAVRFEGRLTRAGTEGGAPPAFQASIADVDMDGDVLHTHTDPHWAPTEGDLEDTREAAPGEAGGYILPVLYPGKAFPANATGTDYKIIRVQVRPKWGGDQSLPRVGTLFFVTEPGMKLYAPNGGAAIPMFAGSYVTQTIDVPPGGLTRDYGILINDGFALWGASATLSARFQWDESIRGSSNVWEYQARDDIRLRSISLKLSIANGGHELGNGLEGEIGEQGSPVDDDKKISEGAYLLVNWDDDDATGQMNADGSWAQLPVPDLEKTGHVENEDNLAKLTMHLNPHLSMGNIELKVTQGASRIKLWTHSTKGEEIVLTDAKKTWNLADPTERADFIERCENGIWIEGVKESYAERDVEIVLTYNRLGELVLTDTVKATVAMINLGNAVYRDNQMGIQTNRGHAALVAYFDGPGPGANFRTALGLDDQFRIIEMDGPTSHRKLDTITGPTQYGCFTNMQNPPPLGDGINYVARLRILAAAKALVARRHTIAYSATDAVSPSKWNGRLNTITALRCDGLVEVCYEINGVDVWGKLRIPDNNTYHFDITAPGDAWTYNGIQTWIAGANQIRDNLEEHNEFLELMWEFTLMPATQCRQVAPEGADTTFTMQNLCQPVGTRGGNP